MDRVCLESLWRQRLHKEGWSSDTTAVAVKSLAGSTWSTYNNILTDFDIFACQHGHSVQSWPEWVAADFVMFLAVKSSRPKARLLHFSAALSCLFRVQNRPGDNLQDLRKLIDGVIKHGTTSPLQRSCIMPLKPFQKLFLSWPPNSKLSLQHLRLKAITLLALTAMLRPSDIVPRSGHIFRCSFVTEHPDASGALSIYLHGIKNDKDRDGFRITLHPIQDCEQLCLVVALLCYMTRTIVHVGNPEGPVFLSLTRPYAALLAKSVAGVLNWAIALCGLDKDVYSAKNFRPTGATAAVSGGMDPDQVRLLGRWKNSDTFLKHYVHSQPSKHMSATILGLPQVSESKHFVSQSPFRFNAFSQNVSFAKRMRRSVVS